MKPKHSEFGMVGMSVKSDSLEDVKEVKGNEWYAEFAIKRLTKSNSFLILDEVFYIAKKTCDGKASRMYHVYRVSDLRYITSSPHTKEKTIEIVQRKYVDYMET